jgi:hypothetical protein
VKFHVTDVDPGSQRHAERLDGAIEVFVIERVLIMPDSSRRVGHFVAHEPNTIVSRIRLDLVHRCAYPGDNRRLHSHRRAGGRKCVVVPAAADGKPAVGDVIIHVALPGMTLAP